MSDHIYPYEKIQSGDYDWMIGKWAIDRMYEKEDGEIPLWAKGDPWRLRRFIYSAHYFVDNNSLDLDPAPQYTGQLCCTIGVMLGIYAKNRMEEHGGVLMLSGLKGNEGHINHVCHLDGAIYSQPVYKGTLADMKGKPRLILLDDKPEWFRYSHGQATLFAQDSL